jgi:hypothetical protein
MCYQYVYGHHARVLGICELVCEIVDRVLTLQLAEVMCCA